MKLRHRLQEKLADRFAFVQYPAIRPADEATRRASRVQSIRFVHPMPIGKRIDLVLLSLGLLLIALAALAAVAFIGYSVLFK